MALRLLRGDRVRQRAAIGPVGGGGGVSDGSCGDGCIRRVPSTVSRPAVQVLPAGTYE